MPPTLASCLPQPSARTAGAAGCPAHPVSGRVSLRHGFVLGTTEGSGPGCLPGHSSLAGRLPTKSVSCCLRPSSAPPAVSSLLGPQVCPLRLWLSGSSLRWLTHTLHCRWPRASSDSLLASRPSRSVLPRVLLIQGHLCRTRPCLGGSLLTLHWSTQPLSRVTSVGTSSSSQWPQALFPHCGRRHGPLLLCWTAPDTYVAPSVYTRQEEEHQPVSSHGVPGAGAALRHVVTDRVKP